MQTSLKHTLPDVRDCYVTHISDKLEFDPIPPKNIYNLMYIMCVRKCMYW